MTVGHSVSGHSNGQLTHPVDLRGFVVSFTPPLLPPRRRRVSDSPGKSGAKEGASPVVT